MSLLPAYMSEAWRCYEQMSAEDRAAINPVLLSISPKNCHTAILPFLAWEHNVDISGLSAEQSRRVLLSLEESTLYRGTAYALKHTLNQLFDTEITEWFETGGNPHTFNVDLKISDDIERLSTITKLIDTAKNARSHYTVNFDLDTVTNLQAASAALGELDIEQKLQIESAFNITECAAQTYRADLNSIIELHKESAAALCSASFVNYDACAEHLTIDRTANIAFSGAGIMRLEFGYTGSDVMHLPIPPVLLETAIGTFGAAVFAMEFGDAQSDIWHLEQHIDYAASSQALVLPAGVVTLDLQRDMETEALSSWRLNNATIINLEIGGTQWL